MASEEAPEVPVLEEIAEEIGEDLAAVSGGGMLMPFVVVLIAGCAAAFYYMQQQKQKQKEIEDEKKKKESEAPVNVSNTISLKDIAYLADQLGPDSTHMDVLWAVASTPETIEWGLQFYNAQEIIREERRQEDKEESKNPGSKKAAAVANLFDLDEDGWADEDDEEDEEAKRKAKLAKDAEEQKTLDRENLQKASGKVKPVLEGFDDGVIGQKWVETTLASVKAWPPKDLGFFGKRTFEYDGKQVSPLDHPGLRRNICMITGRLHSIVLNSHPELLEAGSKKLVDQSYFKGSMEFRSRCAMMLEAALRTAVACRSLKLATTIVETVGMFKIGCYPTQTQWFDGVMQRTYDCVPRLQIRDTGIENPEEKEMATGDLLAVGLELTRLHAEAFTRQKVAMFQKQGIPPQVGLQTYREGWWFLVRGERLDGKGGDEMSNLLPIKTDGILQEVDASVLKKYDTASFEQRLVTAWPMIVQNVAQKTGRLKIQFLAPPVPGKYKFTVIVKSQDFLGADQEFSVEAIIVDASTVVREPKEEKPKEEEEPKKDK